MGADHRALAAVDADRRIPDGDLLGDGPFLVLRRPAGEDPVHREGAHGQEIPLAGHQARRHAGHEIGRLGGTGESAGCSLPRPPGVTWASLAITTARPRGALLTATPLCDEEHVLLASPRWAARIGPGTLRRNGAAALEDLPLVEAHESLPFVARYWAAVFDSRPATSGTVIVPDLRAVLACTIAGAGLSVLPRYLCAPALERGEVVALLDPPVPPLRTYFLVVRTGTLAMPHIARSHEWLLRAAVDWC